MIIIKTSKEIEIMREGGRILAHILAGLAQKVEPGVSTKELDELAESAIKKAGGLPAFKGYYGFPTTLCASFNDEVVHGAARPGRLVKIGDILSLDIGMRYPAKSGMVTDMATTVAVGKVFKQAQKLIRVTKECLELAIKQIRPGVYLGDISAAIQRRAEKNGFNVVRELVGHGVGRKLHEEPQIPNYGLEKTGPILKSGMTLAIEPMLTAGHFRLIEDKKTRAFKTVDGSLAAHFEHTVLVTEKGSEALTVDK